MAWYLAPSLSELRKTLNHLFPNRDKSSDGTIGDAAHRNRDSDHNPNSRNSVNAYDADRDLVPGDVAASNRGMAMLLDYCRNDPEERVEYIIWEGKIYARRFGFSQRTYTGDNGHFKHMHISIRQTVAAEQNTAPWLAGATQPQPQPEEEDMTPEQDAKLQETWQRAKNLEGAFGPVQGAITRIEERVNSLAVAGVDTEAVAKRVADLLAERLKS